MSTSAVFAVPAAAVTSGGLVQGAVGLGLGLVAARPRARLRVSDR